MPLTRNQARALATAAEYQLFAASMADAIKSHTPARLKGKIDRARALRDKYRDLHKRQRLAARERTGSKKGSRLESNVRTEQKARLFEEVLGRFEKRASDLAAATARAEARAASAALKAAAKKKASKKPAVKKASAMKPATARPSHTPAAAKKAVGSRPKTARTTVKKATTKAASGFMSESARGAGLRAQHRNTRAKAVQGHVRATGRRRQARRDSR